MNKKPKYKIDNARLTHLTERAQHGNAKATEEIVNMISGYIYYCLTMLGNPDEAQDAVQDILLIMLQKINTLENPKCFLGWIKTVSCNYCRAKRSRTKDNLSLSEGFEEMEDDDEQICPSHSIETEEVCALVREAVKALPVPHRESVMMFYFHQFSVRQISQVLEISENTVKSRLYSARGMMKKNLEKHGAAAIASYAVAPLSLIAFSLISAAENQKGLMVPYATPSGKVMVAVAKTAAVSSSPIRTAASANILTYTGWSEKAGFEDENTLFEAYIENFTNGGAYIGSGFSWFFNGVMLDNNDAIAVCKEGSGGYMPEYPYEKVTRQLNFSNRTSMTRTLLNEMKKGCGLMFTGIFGASPLLFGAHALNCWAV